MLFEGRRRRAASTTSASRSCDTTRSLPTRPGSAEDGVDSLEENGTCCFAKQDKVWVDGPDGAWEIYAVLEDSETFGESLGHVDDAGDSLCCAIGARSRSPLLLTWWAFAMRRYRPCPVDGPSK